eukprot:5457723-Prymnesium_polylepis.5
MGSSRRWQRHLEAPRHRAELEPSTSVVKTAVTMAGVVPSVEVLAAVATAATGAGVVVVDASAAGVAALEVVAGRVEPEETAALAVGATVAGVEGLRIRYGT